jgi:hypothetical protein
MRKGVKLVHVNIDDGRVTAYDNYGKDVKLTRTQRTALANFKRNPNYVTEVNEAFGREVLDEDFSVSRDGKCVYTLENGCTTGLDGLKTKIANMLK